MHHIVLEDNLMSIDTCIKSFSSYTKGLHSVTDIVYNDQFVELKLLLPLTFRSKLEKRFERNKCSALSIDGVYAEVSFNKTTSKETEYFEITAKVAKKMFSNSALSGVLPGTKVNIGMLSINPSKWLLDSSPIGTVKLNHIGIAKGHTYTKEFTFECTKEIFKRIQNTQYIGINASGLCLREPRSLEGHYYFSIHAGRNTREVTVFGQENLMLGTDFTLTLPFKDGL